MNQLFFKFGQLLLQMLILRVCGLPLKRELVGETLRINSSILVNHELVESRERYFDLIQKPKVVEDLLIEGSKKARPIAQENIKKIRHAVGLKELTEQ